VLSYDPKTRFRDLFLIRKKWARTDILPYGTLDNSVQELASTTKELDALLLKYARLSRVGKEIFLTNRHLHELV
jgi:sister chromatid cohesion protein DCC1